MPLPSNAAEDGDAAAADAVDPPAQVVDGDAAAAMVEGNLLSASVDQLLLVVDVV